MRDINERFKIVDIPEASLGTDDQQSFETMTVHIEDSDGLIYSLRIETLYQVVQSVRNEIAEGTSSFEDLEPVFVTGKDKFTLALVNSLLQTKLIRDYFVEQKLD